MKLTLNAILVIILITVASIIAFGTIAVIVSQGGFPLTMRHSDPLPIELAAQEDLGTFDELGQIRALTKAEKNESHGIPVVVTPWLSYTEKNNTAFYEELSQKNRKIKAIIQDYFAQYTEKQLLAKEEQSVKQELLELINQQLVMGKIASVYFSEYLFLE